MNCVKTPASPGVWFACADEAARGRGQVLDRAAGLVQQLVLEPAEIAEAVTDGGRNGMTIAPVISLNMPNSCPTTAFAEFCSPGRSAKSLSMQNRMPWFGARAGEAEAADAEDVLDLAASSRAICSTCFSMFIVYSSDAPCGAWMMMKM